MNNRRKLVIALGAGALAAPFSSFAQQQGKVWRIGFLGSASAEFNAARVESLRAGLRDLGYVEGRNLEIEWRFADGNYERLANLAAELVQLRLDAVVSTATPATSAMQKATTTIPIVMVGAGDPVGTGLVKSLARPGGNITGLSNLNLDIGPKRLEILLTMLPKLSRVAILVNPSNTTSNKNMEAMQAAGQKRGVKILLAEARTPQEIDIAFSLMRQQNAGALIVFVDPLFQQQRSQIIGLTTKHRVPSIAGNREYAEVGGLISYGANVTDGSRRAATYVDKILKGAKPAELPVEQPTTFEMVINMKTAKALGVKVPNSILVQATKVIE